MQVANVQQSGGPIEKRILSRRGSDRFDRRLAHRRRGNLRSRRTRTGRPRLPARQSSSKSRTAPPKSDKLQRFEDALQPLQGLLQQKSPRRNRAASAESIMTTG